MKQGCVNCQHYSEDEFGLGTCHRLTINTEKGYPSLQIQDGTREPVALTGVPNGYGCALWAERDA